MASPRQDGNSDDGHGLMPPPARRPPKRGREVVLEEEEWVAKMEGIIERDFFPELGRLQDKVAWLEAVRSGDPERIRQAQLQIAHRRQSLHQQHQQLQQQTQYRQGQTPYTQTRGRGGTDGYTPYNTDFPPHSSINPHDDDGSGSGISIPPVSLDTFLANHTSEDNASFNDILDKTNKRRKERAIATLGAPSNDPRLLITDGKERTDGFGTSGQPIDTQTGWKYTAKNMLMYDGSTRNSLALSKRELAGLVPGPPPAINHSATRLHQQVQRNAGLLAVAAGAGSDTPGSTTSIDTESTAAEMTEDDEKGRRGGGSGRGGRGGGAVRNNYDILATPSFDPGVDASPLITWGDIEATPVRIEAEDLPPGAGIGGGGGAPVFKINEGSKRERKAHELAKKAGATLRNRPGGVGGTRGGGTMNTPARAAALAALGRTPASTRGGGGGGGAGGATPLSHAAQKLVGRMKKKQTTGADAALRASYTPRHGGAGANSSSRSRGQTPRSGWESGAATPLHK